MEDFIPTCQELTFEGAESSMVWSISVHVSHPDRNTLKKNNKKMNHSAEKAAKYVLFVSYSGNGQDIYAPATAGLKHMMSLPSWCFMAHCLRTVYPKSGALLMLHRDVALFVCQVGDSELVFAGIY